MLNSGISNIKVFACNSNKELAESIVSKLGLKLGDCEVEKFSDGEISVKINETIRGADVFIIQSTSYPVNDNLMELLIMIDAMKRASAARITAVMPYYGYARQDRKARPRDPISAKLVANLLTSAGADRVLTMDLHCAQIQGFFDIPVDHLLGNPTFVKYYLDKFPEDKFNHEDFENLQDELPVEVYGELAAYTGFSAECPDYDKDNHTWKYFYENGSGWTEEIQLAAISSLKTFGGQKQVMEVILELDADAPKCALVELAIEKNVVFNRESLQLLDGSLPDDLFAKLLSMAGVPEDDLYFDEANMTWDDFYGSYSDWDDDLLRRRIQKLKSFGPSEEVAEVLKNAKAIAVLDKADSLNAAGGALFEDVVSSLYVNKVSIPVVNYVYGIGGRDTKADDIESVYTDLLKKRQI